MKLQSILNAGLASLGVLGLALLLTFSPGCSNNSTITQTNQVVTNTDGSLSTNMILSTNVTTTFNLEEATNIINLALPPLVAFAAKEPGAGQYLTDAAAAFSLVSGGTNLTPAYLSVILATNGVNLTTNAQTKAAIAAGIAFYNSAYSQVIEQKLNQVTNLMQILQSISTGLKTGLAAAGMPSSSIQRATSFPEQLLCQLYSPTYIRIGQDEFQFENVN